MCQCRVNCSGGPFSTPAFCGLCLVQCDATRGCLVPQRHASSCQYMELASRTPPPPTHTHLLQGTWPSPQTRTRLQAHQGWGSGDRCSCSGIQVRWGHGMAAAGHAGRVASWTLGPNDPLTHGPTVPCGAPGTSAQRAHSDSCPATSHVSLAYAHCHTQHVHSSTCTPHPRPPRRVHTRRWCTLTHQHRHYRSHTPATLRATHPRPPCWARSTRGCAAPAPCSPAAPQPAPPGRARSAPAAGDPGTGPFTCTMNERCPRLRGALQPREVTVGQCWYSCL